MEGASNQAKLVFVHGPREGEEIALTGTSYRIGSGTGCEIVLPGPTVEAVHAVLEGDAAQDWQIANRSRIGLLVNGEKKEKARLFHGDRLQLGNEHLLELHIETTSTKKTKRPKKPASKGGLLRSPWLWVGVGLFYTLFFTGLYFIVNPGDEESRIVLTSAKALELLCESERYFAGLGQSDSDTDSKRKRDGKGRQSCASATVLPQSLQSNDTDIAAGSCQDTREDLEALRQARAGSEEHAALEKRLLAALFRRLGDALLLEKQGLHRKLPDTYSQIIDCFPDFELPATSFALQRRRLIREGL